MIYLVLGTNLGDREWNLKRALALLSEALKVDLKCSEVIETESVGFEGPPFLNQAVAFESDIRPETLLDICQKVEKCMGRPEHMAQYDEAGSRIYENRVIDIDILKYYDIEIDTPRLKIPHPQLYERSYVEILLKTITI